MDVSISIKRAGENSITFILMETARLQNELGDAGFHRDGMKLIQQVHIVSSRQRDANTEEI